MIKKSTETVAIKLNIRRESVFSLAFRHKNDLEVFGNINISKITPGKKGGKPREIIYLNNDQEKLLIMLTRNTESTVKHKILLIKEKTK